MLYSKYGIKTLINACGTMTAIGSSRVHKEVMQEMCLIMTEFVEMTHLQERASRIIAEVTGAEAGCITACCASGISIAVAGCMTGCNAAKAEQLPDTTGMKNEVVMMKGHEVNFGGNISQCIRITGAKCIEVGQVNICSSYHIEHAINENTVAGVYVVSHHTVQSGMVPLNEFVRIFHEKGLPVIVDAASESRMQDLIDTGADIVIFSGHKFLQGPTSGIVAGKKDCVKACFMQERGIGRITKVGKESIIGAMSALYQWKTRDSKKIAAYETEILDIISNELDGVSGIYFEKTPDPTGNPITRLKIIVNENITGICATQFSKALAVADPSVIVRSHHTDNGYFEIDPCNMSTEEALPVALAIKDILHDPKQFVVNIPNDNVDVRIRPYENWEG